ncbi:XRE family transcriptional regulator [Flavobacterium sp. MEB061]|uniref:helix-turn-helix transcriptional regulator n=1 Tax=Flavobacterium sp. MEB061 TaxID=1587524 RepID=UPI0005AC5342|nr:helix-turn-helix transcriptional regulator [Flavobacterium sp. MEB061]KIQ16452.1 XRE family transcriptional regulator [Flavobacterium sp. MEB061]
MPGNINENIKRIRELKEYTQEYMALMLNITQTSYNRIEKGKSPLTCDKLEEIVSIFEMDLISIIKFESSLYKSDFIKPKVSLEQCDLSKIETLYRDKIALLEKLLAITDRELIKYKDKYKCI